MIVKAVLFDEKILSKAQQQQPENGDAFSNQKTFCYGWGEDFWTCMILGMYLSE